MKAAKAHRVPLLRRAVGDRGEVGKFAIADPPDFGRADVLGEPVKGPPRLIAYAQLALHQLIMALAKEMQ